MKNSLVCRECGHATHQWMGRCPQCLNWGSLVEGNGAAPVIPEQVYLKEALGRAPERLRTGVGEFDRVLGGGLVAGSTVLVAGEPGVGKSTLMLQAAAGLVESGRRVIVVCGEEAIEQVAARGERIGGSGEVEASAACDLQSVLALMGESDVLVIDSVQTLRDPRLSAPPGSVSQVRECVGALGPAARDSGTALLLIGHVTKDGGVAGPRILEHLVDAVVTFEECGGQALRTIRAQKNRYGSTAEVGMFEMTPEGLTEVQDASALFLSERRPDTPGSVVSCVLEGRRPLALEVQSLTVLGQGGGARRIANGLDSIRLGILAAVIDERAAIKLSGTDVFVSLAGGFRTADPGLDLAVCLSVAGSRRRKAFPSDVAAIGEVGLSGEVRAVSGMRSRVEELARIGFKKVLCSPLAEDYPNVEIMRVGQVSLAVEQLM